MDGHYNSRQRRVQSHPWRTEFTELLETSSEEGKWQLPSRKREKGTDWTVGVVVPVGGAERQDWIVKCMQSQKVFNISWKQPSYKLFGIFLKRSGMTLKENTRTARARKWREGRISTPVVAMTAGTDPQFAVVDQWMKREAREANHAGNQNWKSSVWSLKLQWIKEDTSCFMWQVEGRILEAQGSQMSENIEEVEMWVEGAHSCGGWICCHPWSPLLTFVTLMTSSNLTVLKQLKKIIAYLLLSLF